MTHRSLNAFLKIVLQLCKPEVDIIYQWIEVMQRHGHHIGSIIAHELKEQVQTSFCAKIIQHGHLKDKSRPGMNCCTI